MTRALTSIFVILASLLLSFAGSSLLGTLLSVRMAIEGFDRELIGPILAFHSLGFVLGTLYCPRIIRSVGHIRSFAAFAALICVATLMHPLWINGVSWALLRAVTGFCVAGSVMVMESWINDRTSNDMRGTIMAFYMATSYLAQGGGQFMLSASSPRTTELFIIAAAFIAASLVPLALTRSRAPEIGEHEHMSFVRLFRQSPLAMLAALVSGMTTSAFFAVAPVFAHEVGYSVRQISLFLGVAVLFSMAFQWPVGHFSDRHDRRVVLVLLSVLALLGVVPLMLYAEASFFGLLLWGGIFMGFVGCLYGLCMALTNDLLEPHQMVSASATLLLSLGIGTIIGPVGASIGLALFDGDGFFGFLGVGLSVLVLFGLYRALTARRLRAEDQSNYVPYASVAATTPVIVEMDPRNEDFEPHVQVPAEERRRGEDRRGGPYAGGRRREDAWDANE